MQIDVNDTVLIVVGSELTPEEKDRPLAYSLKSTIDTNGKNSFQRCVVVSDRWYLDNELFQVCPTIMIGGPGVNAATAHFCEKIPVVWNDDEESFLQISMSDTIAKVLIWGLNQQRTEQAMTMFVENGHQEDFLGMVWTST